MAFNLRQEKASTKVSEVCRKIGVAENNYYRWLKES
ncbi:MAG: hypothetical protein E2O72_08745 [Candidatus Dadabacteria bacterium]|nr:transposase [Candidatus Dadabacteria bacterium]TDI88285.1 MAG: hypothetical protein E2O72_08745 [Candidatus Dadabacteria bacterium]TDI98666.1 MAG: hypothetical protein E2O70_09440 [Candidatus Dadabacteria bacterium]